MSLPAAWALFVWLAGPEAPRTVPPATVWRQAAAGWGEPAIDDSSAYVLTRSHEVVAFDLSTGRERWRVHTGGPHETPPGTAVRVLTDMVVLGDDAVIALDRRTGGTRWRFVPERGHGAGVFLGEADDDVVLAGSASGDVYALDSATGRLRWTQRVIDRQGTTVVHPPVLAGECVLVSYTSFGPSLGGGVAAYTRAGRRLWHAQLPDSTGAGGAPHAAGAWVVVARTDGVIQGFALNNGRRRWRLPRARGPARLVRDIRPLVILGDRVVAGSLSGAITAYEIYGQRECWQVEGPSGAAALRLTTDGTSIYAPFTNGTLLVVSVADGKERWRIGERGDAVWWPPGVGWKHVVAVGERSVMAYGRPAGDPEDVRCTRKGRDR